MSRTYRRRGQRHGYRWVLRDWKWRNFVLGPVLVEAHSEEGRRAIGRFHSDAELTIRSSAPRRYTRGFDHRLRTFNVRQLRRFDRQSRLRPGIPGEASVRRRPVREARPAPACRQDDLRPGRARHPAPSQRDGIAARPVAADVPAREKRWPLTSGPTRGRRRPAVSPARAKRSQRKTPSTARCFSSRTLPASVRSALSTPG